MHKNFRSVFITVITLVLGILLCSQAMHLLIESEVTARLYFYESFIETAPAKAVVTSVRKVQYEGYARKYATYFYILIVPNKGIENFNAEDMVDEHRTIRAGDIVNISYVKQYPHISEIIGTFHKIKVSYMYDKFEFPLIFYWGTSGLILLFAFIRLVSLLYNLLRWRFKQSRFG